MTDGWEWVITVDDVIEYLNELVELDRETMEQLAFRDSKHYGIPCGKLNDHPRVHCYPATMSEPSMWWLDIINGIFDGNAGDGFRWKDGTGPIDFKYDESGEEDKWIGFQRAEKVRTNDR